ncbi:MAG: pentapeptide repeat-containing protein, partial [Candidatus Gracilibacteria bacterium]
MLYTNEKLSELKHRWTTIRGKKLIKIIKETHCYLSPIIFREKIHGLPGINDEEVFQGIDLRGISLSGFDFRVPIQDGDDGFAEELAILSDIHFEGATLRHCNFIDGKIHNCFFENSDLTHSNFQNSRINDCSFKESDCLGINFEETQLINCNFVDANIKDIVLGKTLANQKTTFGKILKSEKEGNFHFASIEYKQIKEMYKNSSLHEIADEYHYREMVAKRKISSLLSPSRWANYIFGDLLCKYGISFTRVFLTGLIVIIACAFLFLANNSLQYHSATTAPISLTDALYFSTVTFTTLGYGDFHATGLMRFVAGAESFFGA